MIKVHLKWKEKLAKWEISDRLSLCAIKRIISEQLISGFPEKDDAIEERFQVSDNAEFFRCLMKQLTDIKYDNNWGVREFILRMVHVQTKLRTHNIDLNENFIVSHTLNCLPAKLTPYNTFSENWIVNNLITKCVAEEEKLKKERSDLVILIVHAKSHSG